MTMFKRTIRRTLFVGSCLLLAVATWQLRAAEMRTWTASSGGYKVEAELLALKPGEIAQLRTKDGRTIEVPLAQLTAADQEYARKQSATAAPTKPTTGVATDFSGGSPRFNEVQKQADRCRTPDEALILFKVFHDDAATSATDKTLVAARLAEYKQLAADKKVRLNKKWVSADEAETVRKRADELMRQGIELWKLDQEDGCKRKFTEAASLEPEEIRAEFILGFIYTLNRAADKALPIFQRCLQRDPDNIAVLNNIALLSASRGDWTTMVGYWRKALAKQPDQRVVHNVGRFLSQSVSANVPIPKAPRESLAGPYAELVASGKYKATDPEIGWLLILIEESDLDFSFKDGDDKEAKPEKKSVKPEANEDGVVVGGGTGFVVHPGYVLTNAHVAVDDAVFEIQTSDGKRLRATRVSKAHDADLALLKCDELSAPALTLAHDVAPRGTDVMLLGYPEMFSLGATLKATRGSISSVPEANEHTYLYDAVTNSGNSGGPVCDATGAVIAVHAAGVNTASRYGSGIASTKARTFLAQVLPEAQTVVATKDKLEWPAVDAKVSPSTVLIWVRQKNAAAATTKQVGGDVLELPICLFCNGNKGLRCVAPGCAKMRAANKGRSNCQVCNGSGLVKCEVCAGLGVDPQLASVQEAVLKARAAAGGGTSTSTTGATTPAGATNSAAMNEIDGQISLGRLQSWRRTARPGDPNSLAEGGIDQALGYDIGVLEKPTLALSEFEIRQMLVALQSSDSVLVGDTARRFASSIPVPAFQNDVAATLEKCLMNRPQRGRMKAHVMRALVIWGRAQSRPIVHTMLRDDSWVARRQATITVAHSNDASAVPQLVECLLRPDAFEGDHSESQYIPNNERGRMMRALIVLGEASKAELQRVRPNQNAKVQEMIDFILAACSEK